MSTDLSSNIAPVLLNLTLHPQAFWKITEKHQLLLNNMQTCFNVLISGYMCKNIVYFMFVLPLLCHIKPCKSVMLARKKVHQGLYIIRSHMQKWEKECKYSKMAKEDIILSKDGGNIAAWRNLKHATGWTWTEVMSSLSAEGCQHDEHTHHIKRLWEEFKQLGWGKYTYVSRAAARALQALCMCV